MCVIPAPTPSAKRKPPIRGIVGDPQRLGFAINLDDWRNRPKARLPAPAAIDNRSPDGIRSGKRHLIANGSLVEYRCVTLVHKSGKCRCDCGRLCRFGRLLGFQHSVQVGCGALDIEVFVLPSQAFRRQHTAAVYLREITIRKPGIFAWPVLACPRLCPGATWRGGNAHNTHTGAHSHARVTVSTPAKPIGDSK
jgi:hypothetical protein